jgi:predicted MFS family arabinose efflux permease
MVARFFAGVSAGLAWSLLAGYARRMVAPHLQGRAMSVAMVGTPIALSLGVPLGTWLGNLVGWRTAFGIMSLLTLLLIVWVLAKVPDYPGQSGSKRLPLRQMFTTPGVRPVLGVVVTWMLAHNILYTYVAPFVAPAGLGGKVDVVLLVFGVAALAGIWITGRVVDLHLRAAILASLGAFALTALVLGLWADSAAVMYTCVGVWGLSFGGAATLLQTALADAAADGWPVARRFGRRVVPVGRVDPGVGQYVDRTRGTRAWISAGTQGVEFRGRAALMPDQWHIPTRFRTLSCADSTIRGGPLVAASCPS